MGPHWTHVHCDDDEEEFANRPFLDARLLKLRPGETFESAFTFDNVLETGVTLTLEEGKAYSAELKKRNCWWMYTSELPERETEEERKKILRDEGKISWKLDCKEWFTAGE